MHTTTSPAFPATDKHQLTADSREFGRVISRSFRTFNQHRYLHAIRHQVNHKGQAWTRSQYSCIHFAAPDPDQPGNRLSTCSLTCLPLPCTLPNSLTSTISTCRQPFPIRTRHHQVGTICSSQTVTIADYLGTMYTPSAASSHANRGGLMHHRHRSGITI